MGQQSKSKRTIDEIVREQHVLKLRLDRNGIKLKGLEDEAVVLQKRIHEVMDEIKNDDIAVEQLRDEKRQKKEEIYKQVEQHQKKEEIYKQEVTKDISNLKLCLAELMVAHDNCFEIYPKNQYMYQCVKKIHDEAYEFVQSCTPACKKDDMFCMMQCVSRIGANWSFEYYKSHPRYYFYFTIPHTDVADLCKRCPPSFDKENWIRVITRAAQSFDPDACSKLTWRRALFGCSDPGWTSLLEVERMGQALYYCPICLGELKKKCSSVFFYDSTCPLHDMMAILAHEARDVGSADLGNLSILECVGKNKGDTCGLDHKMDEKLNPISPFIPLYNMLLECLE